MTKYFIPLNEDVPDQSQTVDVLTLEGTKKQKQAAWRRYLSVRCGIWDYHEYNRIAKALGFDELIKK